jgi:hypothetical protein
MCLSSPDSIQTSYISSTFVRTSYQTFFNVCAMKTGSYHFNGMGYELDDWRFESGQGLGIFLFTTASRQAHGSHPASYLMGIRSSFTGVKRPGREGYHSPLASTEVKNAWSYTSTLPIRLHGVVLS